MGEKHWTKRSKETGQFMDQKEGANSSKACARSPAGTIAKSLCYKIRRRTYVGAVASRSHRGGLPAEIIGNFFRSRFGSPLSPLMANVQKDFAANVRKADQIWQDAGVWRSSVQHFSN